MKNLLSFVTLMAALAPLAGCRGQTSSEPPMVPFRGMHEMPRYDAQEESRYFEDGRTMRTPVEGTIPVEMVIESGISEGVDDAGNYLASIPESVTAQFGGVEGLIERGHGRYDIYCSACHAYTGDGNGMVTRRATEIGTTFQAANLHEERIRRIPDGQLFATISNGIRTMPAYRAQIPIADRWAIVAYVRALQLSQGSEPTAMAPRMAPPTEATR